MAKRGQNTGSVSRRKDGRWEARFTLPDGRRKSLYAATRAEVEQKMATALADVRTGDFVDPGKQTIAGLVERWLADVKATRAVGTHRSYAGNARRYILPSIGNVRLSVLGAQHARMVLDRARSIGLAESSLRTLQIIMSAMFKYAVTWQLLSRNPLAGIGFAAIDPRELPITSQAQVDALFDHIAENRYRTAFVLALGLGLRVSEVCGLRWRDVDFDQRELRVRNIVDTTGGEVRFLPPKSKKANRRLPIPLFILNALRGEKVRQAERRLRHADIWQDYDLVVSSMRGRPVDGGHLRKALKRCCVEADVPVIRFHDLRHLCGTILAAQGVPPRVAQAILGHADVTTTLRLYTHLQNDSLQLAADRMDTLFGGQADTGS